jgi:hypothetical protein
VSLPGITGMHGLVGAAASSGSAGGGSPDANTLYLIRYGVSPPFEEITSTSLTLSGNASVDTTNHWMTCDGTGDWASIHTTNFNVPAGDFTLEMHMKVPAAQSGGSMSRRAGINSGSWAWFHNGNGTIDAYVDNISGSPLINFGAGAADDFLHHYMLSRSGNTWYTAVGGVIKGTVTNSGTVGTAIADFSIGTDMFNATARDISGNFGRFKISNICRFGPGGNFTPPAITDV